MKQYVVFTKIYGGTSQKQLGTESNVRLSAFQILRVTPPFFGLLVLLP
jgi:hypothetical protein